MTLSAAALESLHSTGLARIATAAGSVELIAGRYEGGIFVRTTDARAIRERWYADLPAARRAIAARVRRSLLNR